MAEGVIKSAKSPHLDLDVWLNTLDLQQYSPLFQRFNGVEDILDLSSREVGSLGVSNSYHRNRIATSLTILKDKYRKALARNSDGDFSTANLSPKNPGQNCTAENLLAMDGGYILDRTQSSNSYDAPPRKPSPFSASDLNGAEKKKNHRAEKSQNGLATQQRKNYADMVILDKNRNNIHGMANRNSNSSERNNNNIAGSIELSGKPARNESSSRNGENITDNQGNYDQLFRKRTSLTSSNSSLYDAEIENKPWYHGRLSRDKAVCLVKESGEFLVRDCISQPGDYVLTCNWQGTPLHFMINRLTSPSSPSWKGSPSEEKKVYQFEEEQFTSIPDLITFYLTHSKAITRLSRAVISKPVQRPEKGYEDTPDGKGLLSPRDVGRLSDENEPGNYATMNRSPLPFGPPPIPSKRIGIANIPIPNPALAKRPLPTPPKSKPAKMPLSQRVMLIQANRRLNKSSSESKLEDVPDSANLYSELGAKPGRKDLSRFSSAQNLRSTAGDAGKLSKNGPPSKPTRAPSLKEKDRPTVIIRNKSGGFQEISGTKKSAIAEEDDDYHEYCDIDYEDMTDEDEGTGAEEISDSSNYAYPPPLPPRPTNPPERDSACVPDFDLYDKPSSLLAPVPEVPMSLLSGYHGGINSIPIKLDRKIQISSYRSSLLQDMTKPLDEGVWENSLVPHLLNAEPKSVALELFRENCRLLNFIPIDSNTPESHSCAIPLILIPQGDAVRKDLFERSRVMELFVASSILKPKTRSLRAEAITFWIDVALCMKNDFHDLYGFSCVMNGLCSRQVQSLRSSWDLLRMKKTESALIFETAVRPLYQQMSKSGPDLKEEDSVIPYLDPILTFMESEDSDRFFPWEDFEPDYGIEAMLTWLKKARCWLSLSENFAANHAKVLEKHATNTSNPTLQEAVKTEFQAIFLWGRKGAGLKEGERNKKFQHLLTLLSNKCELEPE